MAKITVRATQLGYAGGARRKPGTVFEIDEKLFSKKWMEKVDTDAAPAEEPAAEEPAVPEKGRKGKSTGDAEVI